MSRRFVPAALIGAALLLGGCAAERAEPEREERSAAQREERERVRRVWARFDAAEALRREGRWEEAVGVYAEALEADPDHEGALYGRANCLLELDRHAEALTHLERLVATNPLSQRGHVQLAHLRSAPAARCCFDLDAAAAELERAVEINREETGALLRLAEVRIAQGRFDEAARDLQKVRQANTHSVGAPWLLAWLARREGRHEEAARLLDEASARARGPELPSAVPAEGDTRGDHRLVASTLPGKRAVPPLWEGLETRHDPRSWAVGESEGELARLDRELSRLPSSAR